MQIHTGHDALAGAGRGGVIAIGSFDAIHLGHRAVINFAQCEARLRDVPSCVLTFSPHPRRFFAPVAPRFELAPLRSKARHLHELGVDHLFVLPFDEQLRSTTAEAFVSEVIVAGLGAAGIVVGEDFRFGAGRQGDVKLLNALGRNGGFTVDCLAPVRAPGGQIYSSSNIRRLLAEGRPRQARMLLGRSWGLHGNVVRGDAWSGAYRFPVALDISEYMLPKPGIYAAWAGLESATDIDWRASVAMVRAMADGQRCEPGLALSLEGGERGNAEGRVWVSFEEFLDADIDIRGSFEAGDRLRRWTDAALAFLRSHAGEGTRPPAVSLARARQMAALDL